jgi:hypothetical protein
MELAAAGEDMKKLREIARVHIARCEAGDMQATQRWREQIKERGSVETVYREVRKRQREYRDRDVG